MSPRPPSARDKICPAILDAAEVEFAQHGYGGARLQRIADGAEVPKANVLYYFGSKQGLYATVLKGVLQVWDEAFDQLHPEDDPAQALAGYVRAKMRYSRDNARAARILTSEILQGAPELRPALEGEVADRVRQRAAVIEHWVQRGQMAPVNPYHVIYMIWGSTQYYADYAAQLHTLHGEALFAPETYAETTEAVVQLILRACGLEAESTGVVPTP